MSEKSLTTAIGLWLGVRKCEKNSRVDGLGTPTDGGWSIKTETKSALEMVCFATPGLSRVETQYGDRGGVNLRRNAEKPHMTILQLLAF